jgi:uncharacterized protein
MEADENPDTTNRKMIDVDARRLRALMITGIILPLLLYPFLSMLIIPTGIDYSLKLFISRLLIWATVGIMFLYARRGEVQKFFLWDEQQYDVVFYIKAIIGVYLLCFAAGFVAYIPVSLGLHEDNTVFIKAMVAMKKYPALMYFGAITAGITEEFIFRGYILSRLSVFFKNKHVAVIISALLFAFIHLSYKTYRELLFAFLLGLVFGYHYQKYRNIKVVVAVHFLVDIIAFLLFKTPHK